MYAELVVSAPFSAQKRLLHLRAGETDTCICYQHLWITYLLWNQVLGLPAFLHIATARELGNCTEWKYSLAYVSVVDQFASKIVLMACHHFMLPIPLFHGRQPSWSSSRFFEFLKLFAIFGLFACKHWSKLHVVNCSVTWLILSQSALRLFLIILSYRTEFIVYLCYE